MKLGHKREKAVDYRNFRISEWNMEEFRHVKLLLYWIIFGILFELLEFTHTPDYVLIHCAMDDHIPFCELFVIPYVLWFFYLIGMHLYTLLYDVETFKKMMYFIIFTYTAALAVYLAFPNGQDMRPTVFQRDNALTDAVKFLYLIDTNTNVCPSLHVIGSAAVHFASLHAKGLQTRGWRAFFLVMTVLISISTVFLKQHSVIDLIAALPICAIGYGLVYNNRPAFKRAMA